MRLAWRVIYVRHEGMQVLTRADYPGRVVVVTRMRYLVRGCVWKCRVIEKSEWIYAGADGIRRWVGDWRGKAWNATCSSKTG
jgi:hypothetical protein